MFSYAFSTREKILLVALAVILVAIAWFVLIYQGTTNEITRLEGEIASTQSTITVEEARLKAMNSMQKEIDAAKAAGAAPVPVPAYDNLRPLMAELNTIMGMTNTYTLSFDKVNAESGSYVNRGVRIDFSCNSYAEAENVVKALAGGTYPCVIDSITVADGTVRTTTRSGTATCNASIHVTFFERAA